jgi:hypothetical protein
MTPSHLVESVGASSSKDILVALGCLSVRQRELEVFGDELLDVRSPDVLGLLNLDDLEDLFRWISGRVSNAPSNWTLTWIDLKRAR